MGDLPDHTWEEYVLPSDYLHICSTCGRFTRGPEGVVGHFYDDEGVADIIDRLRGSGRERAEPLITQAEKGGHRRYNGGPLLRPHAVYPDRQGEEPISHGLCDEHENDYMEHFVQKYGPERAAEIRARVQAQLAARTHTAPVVPPVPPLEAVSGDAAPSAPSAPEPPALPELPAARGAKPKRARRRFQRGKGQ